MPVQANSGKSRERVPGPSTCSLCPVLSSAPAHPAPGSVPSLFWAFPWPGSPSACSLLSPETPVQGNLQPDLTLWSENLSFPLKLVVLWAGPDPRKASTVLRSPSTVPELKRRIHTSAAPDTTFFPAASQLLGVGHMERGPMGWVGRGSHPSAPALAPLGQAGADL